MATGYKPHESWLCPACSTPIWVDWEWGRFLCPECDKELFEIEMGIDDDPELAPDSKPGSDCP